MKYGKTAAYTIIKNELKHLETWLHYTSTNFDYQVILDTGSTDGSYEFLLEQQASHPGLIVEQKTFTPWNFSVARNYNLRMIPKEVVVAAQVDADEWYSINVVKKIEQVYETNPNWTSIACTRLDIYSEEVFVGKPKHIGTNKIHKLWDEDGNYLYEWQFKIYECIGFQPKGRNEVEVWLNDLFLIHNQDFSKPERSPLYKQMLIDAHAEEPESEWYGWFLANLYYKERDLENFVRVGAKFVRYHKHFDSKFDEVLRELVSIYKFYPDLTDELRQIIYDAVSPKVSL